MFIDPQRPAPGEEGLAAAQHAIRLYRVMAAGRPEVWLPVLAESLAELAAHLQALRRYHDAFEVLDEEVRARRTLAALRSGASFLGGVRHVDDEAYARAYGTRVPRGSKRRYRALARSQPEILIGLAASLTRLAVAAEYLLQEDLLLVELEEAVLIHRILDASYSDSYRPALAESLHRLARCLKANWQPRKARAAEREAQRIVEQLHRGRSGKQRSADCSQTFSEGRPMSREVSSRKLLVTGTAFMRDIGMLLPAGMDLTGAGLDFTFVLDDAALGRRTAGPYVDDHEPVDLTNWAALRAGLSMAGYRPQFAIDTHARWARIHVQLDGIPIRALIVVPEDALATSVGALGKWQNRTIIMVKLALSGVEDMLDRCHRRAGGIEPQADLRLRYRANPDYATPLAESEHSLMDSAPPVHPVLEMRWRSATSAQRKAFVELLGDVRTAGMWPRRRVVTQIKEVEFELLT